MADPAVKEVVFTAGGNGAGKTTFGAPEGSVVLDSTASNLEHSRGLVQSALDAGKGIQIAYTYRPIDEALNNGVLDRALDQGRTVPISTLIQTHEGSAKTVRELYDEYRGNPMVNFTFTDNGGAGPRPGTIDLATQRDYAGTRDSLHAILESRRAELPAAIYLATKGAGLSGARQGNPGARPPQSPESSAREESPAGRPAPRVDAGTTREGPAVHGTPAASAGRVPGGATEVLVPGEDRTLRGRYEVRELSAIQPSHVGQTFSPNPRHTRKNERDYSKAENQQRVVENSSEEKFNPRYHITDNPDASNGPPVVDENGSILGGNSRGMILQRVYGRNGRGANAYRTLLEKQAAQFGIDPRESGPCNSPCSYARFPTRNWTRCPAGRSGPSGRPT